MKKNRSCKIKSYLDTSFDPRVNLLPKGDMVAIMQKLLEFPKKKVHELTTNDDAPSFIYACAKMIDENRLNEYIDAMRICQEMYENEKK